MIIRINKICCDVWTDGATHDFHIGKEGMNQDIEIQKHEVPLLIEALKQLYKASEEKK